MLWDTDPDLVLERALAGFCFCGRCAEKYLQNECQRGQCGGRGFYMYVYGQPCRPRAGLGWAAADRMGATADWLQFIILSINVGYPGLPVQYILPLSVYLCVRVCLCVGMLVYMHNPKAKSNYIK